MKGVDFVSFLISYSPENSFSFSEKKIRKKLGEDVNLYT